MEKLYTIQAAANLKGVAYNTIYDAIERGQIKPRPEVEGTVVIPESELEQYRPQRRSTRKKVHDRIADLKTFVE